MNVVLLRKLGIFLSETEKNKKIYRRRRLIKACTYYLFVLIASENSEYDIWYFLRKEERKREWRAKQRWDLTYSWNRRKLNFQQFFYGLWDDLSVCAILEKVHLKQKRFSVSVSFVFVSTTPAISSLVAFYMCLIKITRGQTKKKKERRREGTRLCRQSFKDTFLWRKYKTKRYGRLEDSRILIFFLLLFHGAK